MIDFEYTARDTLTGQVVKARVKADSTQSAAKLLAKQDLFAVDIRPAHTGGLLHRLGIAGRISAKEKVLFTRQLSTLINAGLPLARGLRTVREQIKSESFGEVIENVVAAVEGGSSLADAFAQHPKVFNEIYVALVAAGETSGTLDKTLLRLAAQQEKEASIAGKIRSAMIYPLIVLVLVVGVVVLMLTTVVPQVASLYKDLDKELPLATQVMVFLSNFIVNFWWLTIILVGGGGYFTYRMLMREDMKRRIDALKMTVPVFGVLFRKVYMARFARTMNTMLASGIPMIESLGTAQKSIGNRVVADELGSAIKEVRGGKSLSSALEKSPHFLDLVPQMTKIGEESGATDEMMGRAATYYEDEVDEAIKNLSTTLEPMMMVILGVIVGLVLVAVLGPVYSLVGGGSASTIK